MKKLNNVLVLVLSLCLLAGCTGGNEPLKKMPTSEELAEYTKSHTKEENAKRKAEVADLINLSSHEEVCEILEKSLQNWVDLQK